MIKTVYFIFFVCAFALGLMACSSQEKDKFKNLSADEFERLIQDNEVQVVDVRTVAEYSNGHIARSININVLDDNFSATADEILDKTYPVAVYCRSGKRSRNAARILHKKGFRVYNLDKGFENWKEMGKDITY